MNRPYTLLCDPGIDDMVALMVLCGAGAPPAQVIATAGNVDLAAAVRNTAGLLQRLRPVTDGITLGAGCDRAVGGPYPGQGLGIHGDDGLGGRAPAPGPHPWPWPPAAGDPEPPAGRYLVTSPLSHVVPALRRGDPLDITWMGGARECDGNATAVAEFNAWLDPEAADEVLRAPRSTAVVPLDVTDLVTWDAADLDAFDALGGPGTLAAGACRALLRHGPVTLPDAVAAVAFLRPELFAWRDYAASCETGPGPLRGMTECLPSDRPTASVAVDVNVAEVREVVWASMSALARGLADEPWDGAASAGSACVRTT
ncbi:nucleoside hydrolase [Streptomyces sp. NPDC057682]|uniref:nucleoside hydrolase n=1 Tax=Streptomyces sp. NPDC057682 TaxID=3346210 RepID=UPI0036C0FA98